jgi:hypothetical protein
VCERIALGYSLFKKSDHDVSITGNFTDIKISAKEWTIGPDFDISS